MSRRAVQQICLWVAAVALLGALVISRTGGLDVELAGIRLRARSFDRGLWLALLALVGYVAAGGPLPVATARRMVRPGSLATGLALVVGIAAWVKGAHAVGGADSYGYLSQATMWLRGTSTVPQPWAELVPWPFPAETFAPLGYTVLPGSSELRPSYSPGLPILMALGIAVLGACGGFVIVPMAAAVAVRGTYELGRGLATPWVGLGAAALLTASPVFLNMAMQPMSDVPVTAAWVVAFAAALRSTVFASAISGLSASAAIVIRMNLLPMTAPLLALHAHRTWQAVRAREPHAWRRGLVFGVCQLSGIIGVFAYNWHMFGSPLRSGYGSAGDYFAWSNLWPNLWRYASWLTDAHTPVIWAGVALAFVPLRRIWPRDTAWRVALALAAFSLLFIGEYGLYLVFDDSSFLRFFLPVLPIVCVALVRALTLIARNRIAALAVASVVAGLALRGLAEAKAGMAFDQRPGHAWYATAARVVAAATEPDAVIFAMQHSGSLQLYAGRVTMRYDFLDPGWLDDGVGWMSRRKVHVYALLQDFEVQAWRDRFARRGVLGRLDLEPIRRLSGPSAIALYDLTSAVEHPTRIVHQTPADLDCQPLAGPLPTPLWARQP